MRTVVGPARPSGYFWPALPCSPGFELEKHDMSVFADPRDPRLVSALQQARVWCEGHVIDGLPAFEYAVRVARCLDEHLVDLSVGVAIAALLHASSIFADAIALDTHLAMNYGHPVPRIVRALRAERATLTAGDPEIDTSDMLVLYVSTADKIVAFHALLDRARASGDEARFFVGHPALALRAPYFQRFAGAVTGLVPDSMSTALREVLAAITAGRTS
ncbi:hypothetical protein AB0A63_31545 [Lentzea sp. NPDC042327]|uniref:hypothetical protein n=1 Tax=Lentzea sp. NPDC042327 TaxID=3154801 RepID=UPI0033F669CE